jgi:hypothetical protein
VGGFSLDAESVHPTPSSAASPPTHTAATAPEAPEAAFSASASAADTHATFAPPNMVYPSSQIAHRRERWRQVRARGAHVGHVHVA